ncbi:hypothetical protein [Geothrix campi]|uniref:hypothetical protein n=1 Tax=Geothrix campi TaxID=2966450 RepID=UPI002148485D|nr:hypothetical protein [Geothrix sp. SG10]
MEQSWFEFSGIKQITFSNSVWIPLRSSQYIREVGTQGRLGRIEDYLGIHTLAIHERQKIRAQEMQWDSFCGSNSGPIAERNRYTPTGFLRSFYRRPCGIELVLEQRLAGEKHNIWHLDQDLVFALGLLREGDSWVRPAEDYREAVRLKTDTTGRPTLIEIRQDLLKDYLCARKLGLCVLSYQERVEIRKEADGITWEGNSAEEAFPGGRWTGHVTGVDAQGMPVGDIAILHITRPDVNPNEDDPRVSHSDPMETSKETFRRKAACHRICGQLWKTEWVEPGVVSTRVRGDKESPINFVVGASGGEVASSDLEAGGRWIWFRPGVIPALSNRRGGSLTWNTRETGSVSCSPDGDVVFGLNRTGLIAVYAKDISYLPNWQQRIWSAYNVSPEGGLPSELHRMQVVGQFVDSRAPETLFSEALTGTEQVFLKKTGLKLFVDHDIQSDLLSRLSRFDGMDWPGLLALAKDIARLTADSLNKDSLKMVVMNPGTFGSLKLLEKFLVTMVTEPDARQIMAPLFCIYDLRLGDAHLPATNLEQRLEDLGVNRQQPYVWQSAHMLFLCAQALARISRVIATP